MWCRGDVAKTKAKTSTPTPTPSPTSVFPGSNISLVTLANTVLLTPSKVQLATKSSTLIIKLPKILTFKSMISQVTRTKGSPSPTKVKT